MESTLKYSPFCQYAKFSDSESYIVKVSSLGKVLTAFVLPIREGDFDTNIAVYGLSNVSLIARSVNVNLSAQPLAGNIFLGFCSPAQTAQKIA